jgi:uncharacterized protein with ATP-grasp and redox domains
MSAHLTNPPPLMTSEPGSFARACIVERKPQIIQQVIENNAYPPDILAALEGFRDEVVHLPIQPICEPAPDTGSWNDALAEYSGKTWLEVPWYFAETYFYRRLLEITRYFQPGRWKGQNPFQKQKISLMDADIQRLAPMWEQFYHLEPEDLFEGLLHSSLWGNRADLSNFTIQVKAHSGLDALEQRHLVLIDDTDQVRQHLAAGVGRVDFINDNVGGELLFDLALADFFLQAGWARRVNLHLKNQPFFVSDAMPDDVQYTIALLKAISVGSMRELGERLVGQMETGRLNIRTDPFWTTWLMFRQMPPHLSEQLAQADLVLAKGDVNYRRLTDDAHWPFTTRMEDITAYFPASFAVIRTLKGEILVGLKPGQAEALSSEDPTWLINGKRGVIHFVNKSF